MAYTPTEADLNQLLSMLTDSINGHNSKQVNDQLMSYANEPNFSLLLCTVIASATQCVSNALPHEWSTYRAAAGLTLKRALMNKKIQLADAILVTSGQATTQVLSTETNPLIIRTAAQIYSHITARIGRLDWWATSVGSDMQQFLLGTLLRSSAPAQVKAALYALQYLLEDAAGPIGDASEVIIGAIADFAATQTPEVRRHCFALICQVYELGAEADWSVDIYTPMQHGLCNSSYRVAEFATQMSQTEAVQDAVLMRDVLSCFSTLLDYLDSFASAPNLNLEAVANSWVATAVAYFRSTDEQVATAALNFIIKLVGTFERVSGEGPIVAMYNALVPHLVTITQGLFPLMLMREEEERSKLQFDNFTERDANRTQSNIKKTFGDDASADGDETIMSVRRSASNCLDHLCRLDSAVVFPLILDVCLTKWEDADWRFREVSILALGAAVHGAYAELDPYFNEFVPKLIASIKLGTSQHRCITAMATWAAQRMSVWICSVGSQFIATYIDALLANLTSESKMIQRSCVSALRFFIMTLGALGLDVHQNIGPYFPRIVQSVVTCVPHYHTTNLKLLCDLAIDLMNLSPSQESTAEIVAPFVSVFPDRFGKLGQTFHAFYNENQTTIVVDTDVFDVARVIYTYYQNFANPTDVFQHLSSWVQVLAALAGAAITDDPELAEQPTRLMSMLLVSLPSAALSQYTELSTLGQCVSWLLQHPSASVQGAALALLSDMINGFGPQVYSAVPIETLVQQLTPLVTPTTDLNVLIDASRTIRVLSASIPPQHIAQLVTALSLCIRSDVYESTRDGHSQLAFDLCAILPTLAVTAAPLSAMSCIAELLHGSANEYEKAEATVGFCALVVSPHGQQTIAGGASDGSLANFIHSFFKMVFSWQKMADGQCYQALSMTINTLLQQHNATVMRVLSTNPQGYVNDIMTFYGVR